MPRYNRAVISLVDPALEEYCRAHTVPAARLRDELFAYTQAHCQLPQMLTGPLEGALLAIILLLGRRLLPEESSARLPADFSQHARFDQ